MCMYHASWERRAEVAHVHRRSQPHNCAMGRPPTFFSVGGPVSGWYGSAYTRMKAWIERRQAGSDRLLPVSQSQCRRKRSLVVESRISKACTRPNRRTSTADIRNGSTSTCRNINRRVTRAATFPHAPVRGCRQRGVEVWPTSWDRLHAHQGSRARDTLAWRPRPVGRPCRAVLVPRQGGERAPRAEAPSLHPSPTCHCGNLLYSVAWDHESLSRGCHPPPPHPTCQPGDHPTLFTPPLYPPDTVAGGLPPSRASKLLSVGGGGATPLSCAAAGTSGICRYGSNWLFTGFTLTRRLSTSSALNIVLTQRCQESKSHGCQSLRHPGSR